MSSAAPSTDAWPGGFAVAQVCIARPTARFDEVLAFYCDGLGLPVLFQFEAGGAKGGMVGLPASGHHLEFIQPANAAVGQFGAPDKLHALVLHLPNPADVEKVSQRLQARGLRPVTPGNPYWTGRAVVFDDPDGWPVVLAAGNGLQPGSVSPSHIERAMDFHTYLQRIPKVDLHCHLVGTLRPHTLAQLAQKHGLRLPRPAETLYDFTDFYDFLDVLRLASAAMRSVDDFSRVTYEALEDGNAAGNLRHAELLFNPQYFHPYGVSYRTMVDGMLDGMAGAARDFGVSALLVASFDRMIDAAGAMQILDDVLAYRKPQVAGIGLDGAERTGPPQRFAEVYARAGAAGLKRTAHVCEDNQSLEEAPPENYAICHDLLHCDRLDHGYNLLADPAMTARARDEGLYFNTCTITSVTRNLERRRASIAKMVDLGLKVTLNTDDPVMFKTDIAHSYQVLFSSQPHWGVDRARAFSLDGVAASWLDDGVKAVLAASFRAELDTFEQEQNGQLQT